MKGKQVATSLYLDPVIYETLKEFSAKTRVPVAEYLREAITDLLAKYKVKVPKGKAKP